MPESGSTTDRELLKAFSERGSHDAFVALVKRHGPMVHAVSQRVLSNHHDAEDVTQAVFLKLAREAGRLGGRSSVAGWLHTVSHRLSLNARQSRESRQKREQDAMRDSIDATPDATLSAGFRRELDAARDPDAALAWAKTVGHPEERVEALAAVLPSWQLKHPDQGIDGAVDLEQIPVRRYEYLIETLVSDWAVTDPSAAIDYALQLAEPELKNRMVSSVVESWVRKDSEEARQWSLALPSGEIRDRSLTTMGERLAMTDFGAAGRVAGQIGDREAENHAIHRIMTAGKGIRHHFDEALKLADREMPELPFDDLRSWAHEVRREDIPAFRDWLERARDADRIRWQTDPQALGVDSEKRWQFIIKGLRPEQE